MQVSQKSILKAVTKYPSINVDILAEPLPGINTAKLFLP